MVLSFGVAVKRIIIVTVLVGFIMGVVWLANRNAADTPIAAMGGEAFEVELPSALYRQNDSRWASDHLGKTNETLGAVGCTVSAVAMGLGTYGVDVTPRELNARLTVADGYNARGRLKWAAIEQLFGSVAVDWSRPLAHATLDEALRNGEPIVTRITLSSGIEHWVLVIGKRGLDYLARDPLAPEKPVMLSSYDSPIRSIRVLRSTGATNSPNRDHRQ